VRGLVDADTIRRLLVELGRRSRGPGRVYLVGGATALLEGWRQSTVDVDLKLDPEPEGIFEAIAELKDELRINVELAAPDQFLPPLRDWRDRSRFIARHGEIDFFHYDLRAQALSKLARGYERDLGDVRAMLDRGLTSAAEIRDGLEQMRSGLVRYPALDAASFVRRVNDFLAERDA
jgi:hypothetical protein